MRHNTQVSYRNGVLVINDHDRQIILDDIYQVRLALEDIRGYSSDVDDGDFCQRVAVADMIQSVLDQMVHDREIQVFNNGNIYEAHACC